MVAASEDLKKSHKLIMTQWFISIFMYVFGFLVWAVPYELSEVFSKNIQDNFGGYSQYFIAAYILSLLFVGYRGLCFYKLTNSLDLSSNMNNVVDLRSKLIKSISLCTVFALLIYFSGFGLGILGLLALPGFILLIWLNPNSFLSAVS